MNKFRDRLNYTGFHLVAWQADGEIVFHEAMLTRAQATRFIDTGEFTNVVAVYQISSQCARGHGSWTDVTGEIAQALFDRSYDKQEEPDKACAAFLDAHGYGDYWREIDPQDAVDARADHYHDMRVGG